MNIRHLLVFPGFSIYVHKYMPSYLSTMSHKLVTYLSVFNTGVLSILFISSRAELNILKQHSSGLQAGVM